MRSIIRLASLGALLTAAKLDAARLKSRIGKTATPEFGSPCYTEPEGSAPAVTPWDRTRMAGGSSGGGSVPSGYACPVPGSSFIDSWGFARSGGRAHQGVDMMAPFGGYKQSGIGRETHKMMLDHYQQTKNILQSYSPKKLGFF